MRFFDLDGTLLDLWPRYYKVFCSILAISDISFRQYKEKKQELKKDEKVAAAFGYRLPADYFRKKSEFLERKDFLKFDKMWFSKTEIQKLFRNDSMILTKRRYSDNLKWQLNKLGIKATTVIVGEMTKLQWIENNYPKEDSLMIGDSIMDLETGYLPNVLPVMVGYGLETRKQFDNLGISYLYLDSAKEVFDYLVE